MDAERDIKTSGRCVRPDEKLILVYFRIIFRPPTMYTPVGNQRRVASAVGVGFIVMAWGVIVCVSPCGAERDESRPYA